MCLRNTLHHIFESDSVICSFQCFIILEPNLMLPARNLMVGALAFNAKSLHRKHDIPSYIRSLVSWFIIKISAYILWLRNDFSIFPMEKEEFKLRTNTKLKAKFLCFLQSPLQNKPRISYKMRSIRIIDIT